MTGTEKEKPDSGRPHNKPFTDDKPTGRPTDDRFNTETAHHDVADTDDPGSEAED
jgi:hypothetical protein